MRESWKYVSVWNCIKIMLGCIIFALVAVIPFAFTEEGIIYTFQLLPIVGDGSLSSIIFSEAFIDASLKFSPAMESFMDIIKVVCDIGVHAYFIILIADFLIAILLIATRSRIIRLIVKILSIFCGFLLIAICLTFLLYLIVAVPYLIYEIGLMPTLLSSGLLTALGFFVLGLIFAFRQFKWFRKPFPLRFYKKDRELSLIMK